MFSRLPSVEIIQPTNLITACVDESLKIHIHADPDQTPYLMKNVSASKLNTERLWCSSGKRRHYWQTMRVNVGVKTQTLWSQTLHQNKPLISQMSPFTEKNRGMRWKHSRLTFHMSSACRRQNSLRIVALFLSSSSCSLQESSYSPNNDRLFITAHRASSGSHASGEEVRSKQEAPRLLLRPVIQSSEWIRRFSNGKQCWDAGQHLTKCAMLTRQILPEWKTQMFPLNCGAVYPSGVAEFWRIRTPNTGPLRAWWACHILQDGNRMVKSTMKKSSENSVVFRIKANMEKQNKSWQIINVSRRLVASVCLCCVLYSALHWWHILHHKGSAPSWENSGLSARWHRGSKNHERHRLKNQKCFVGIGLQDGCEDFKLLSSLQLHTKTSITFHRNKLRENILFPTEDSVYKHICGGLRAQQSGFWFPLTLPW